MPPHSSSGSRTTALTRRTALVHAATGIGLLSGCIRQNYIDQSSPPTPTPTPTQTATPQPTPTPPAAVHDFCTANPAIESDDPLTVSFKSREQFKCRGQAFENFEDLDKWIVDSGSASLETTDVFEGSQAVALRSDETDGRMRIVQRFEHGIDFSGHDISIAAKLVNPTQESISLQLLAPDRENRILMSHPIQQRWGWSRLDFGPTREDGDPDLTDVREIRIGAYTGDDRAATVLLDAFRVTERGERGQIILTFDDNHISQFENAYPVLKQYGYPGVAGVIPWTVGGSDKIRFDQILSLRDSDWDIVSHPQRPVALPDLSEKEQDKAFRQSKQWLVDHGFDDGARFIIWPFGEFDPSSMRFASKYHRLGFCGAYCPSGLQFTGPLSLTRLNANDVSLQKAKEIIDLTAKYNQLLTITFHQVGEREGQVSEYKFKQIIEHIDQTPVSVITASELWEQTADGL